MVHIYASIIQNSYLVSVGPTERVVGSHHTIYVYYVYMLELGQTVQIHYFIVIVFLSWRHHRAPGRRWDPVVPACAGA